MAADEDEIGSDEAVNDGEGSSGKRIKPPVDPKAKAMWDAFAARTAGMSAAEVDREVDRYVDEIVERNLAAAPAGMRDHMREIVRGYVEEDPTLMAMVADLRAAARR